MIPDVEREITDEAYRELEEAVAGDPAIAEVACLNGATRKLMRDIQCFRCALGI